MNRLTVETAFRLFLENLEFVREDRETAVNLHIFPEYLEGDLALHWANARAVLDGFDQTSCPATFFGFLSEYCRVEYAAGFLSFYAYLARQDGLEGELPSSAPDVSLELDFTGCAQAAKLRGAKREWSDVFLPAYRDIWEDCFKSRAETIGVNYDLTQFDSRLCLSVLQGTLSIDDLPELEHEVYMAYFFRISRDPGPEQKAAFLRAINEGLPDSEKISETPSLDHHNTDVSLANQILDNTPRFPIVDIMREYLALAIYEPDRDEERLRYASETAVMANFHAEFERSDEKKAFDEMMIELGVPAGELRRFCTQQFLMFVVARDFPNEAVDWDA